MGADLEGCKRVLEMWIEQTEGAKFWAGLLTELRNRGVADVLTLCCDGLTGLPEAYAPTSPRLRSRFGPLAHIDRAGVGEALEGLVHLRP